MTTVPYPDEISRAEAEWILDEGARRWLGMSGEEFARRHDRGDLPRSAMVEHLSDLLDLSRQ
jgi:hypothetical protein